MPPGPGAYRMRRFSRGFPRFVAICGAVFLQVFWVCLFACFRSCPVARGTQLVVTGASKRSAVRRIVVVAIFAKRVDDNIKGVGWFGRIRCVLQLNRIMASCIHYLR